jgi:hypothetical protein
MKKFNCIKNFQLHKISGIILNFLNKYKICLKTVSKPFFIWTIHFLKFKNNNS